MGKGEFSEDSEMVWALWGFEVLVFDFWESTGGMIVD